MHVREGREGALAATRTETRSVRPHFMLAPSLTCPASCAYCFGPNDGPTMSAETMQASLDFIDRITSATGQNSVKVTFHGGEPLAAGLSIWRQSLDGLRARFGEGGCEVGLQSNLWLLTNEFCELFRDHSVDIGTSLDGPREINDRLRGEGCFDRTMLGIRTAEAHGVSVGCIATFTPFNAPRWRQVLDFFLWIRAGPETAPTGTNTPTAE